jgi:hypothetical protein
MTDYADWGDQTAAAAAIATGDVGGAPGGAYLLTGKTVISQAAPVVPANGTTNLGPFTMPRPGWELGLSLTATAGTTLDYTLTWTDSVTGLTVEQERWKVTCGYSASPHVIYGSGRARGDTLAVKLTAGSLGAITVSYTLLATTTAPLATDMRTLAMGGGNGGLGTGGNIPDGLILTNNETVNLAAATAVLRALPLYSGPVQVQAHTASGLADLQVVVADMTGLMGNWNNVYNAWSNSKGVINDTLYLPRAQCQITYANNNAAAQTCDVALIIAQQSP